MASGLPPPPVNDQPGSFAWLEWYRQLRTYVSTSGSVPWYIINFSGSNLTDLATRLHNNLQGLQGGTSGEQYHLTAAQHAALSAGPHNNLSGLQGGTTAERYHLTATQHNDIINGTNTTLHYHDSDRDRANHTGTQEHTTITGLGPLATQAAGFTGTVALAKLTTGGTNGSMTLSNGVVTAYTAPT